MAALLLKQQGHDVIGIHMSNWDHEEEGSSGECSEREREDARLVCDRLGIGFHPVSFIREYWQDVFQPFVEGIVAGGTPNPDVSCNQHIKFDRFHSHAISLGAEWVATGHYARVRHRHDGVSDLLTAADPNKDQTYFLSTVSQAALRRALFPLGHLPKASASAATAARLSPSLPTRNARLTVSRESSRPPATRRASPAPRLSAPHRELGHRCFQRPHDTPARPLAPPPCPSPTRLLPVLAPPPSPFPQPEVRRIAGEANLHTALKKDSTGICFVGKRKFRDFIRGYLPDQARGPMVCIESGRVLGRHEGLLMYTHGQRARVGGLGGRWCVRTCPLAPPCPAPRPTKHPFPHHRHTQTPRPSPPPVPPPPVLAGWTDAALPTSTSHPFEPMRPCPFTLACLPPPRLPSH